MAAQRSFQRDAGQESADSLPTSRFLHASSVWRISASRCARQASSASRQPMRVSNSFSRAGAGIAMHGRPLQELAVLVRTTSPVLARTGSLLRGCRLEDALRRLLLDEYRRLEGRTALLHDPKRLLLLPQDTTLHRQTRNVPERRGHAPEA